tara:strand:+ start:356 stop:625 length:270 start_codon:yes stop_codon:yes gene_type:complete
MFIKSFCPPAIVYLVFSFTHVLMAVFDNDKKGAFLQAMMGILISLLLQVLCMNGLSIISWIIAFLPLIFYTYMVILLYSIFEKGEKVKK